MSVIKSSTKLNFHLWKFFKTQEEAEAASSLPPSVSCGRILLGFPGGDQLLSPQGLSIPVTSSAGDRPPTQLWPFTTRSLKQAALTYAVIDILVSAGIFVPNIVEPKHPVSLMQENQDRNYL